MCDAGLVPHTGCMFRISAAIVVSAAAVLTLCACGSGEDAPPADEVFASRMASEVYDSTVVAVPESVSFAESVCQTLDGGVFDPGAPRPFLDAFAARLHSVDPTLALPKVRRQIELSVEWKCPEYSDAVQLWVASS